MKRLRLGTRRSRLALVQSDIVARRLRAAGVEVELVEILTEGDVRPKDSPIAEGVFVAALERALRAELIDIAVHSAKDVPLDLDVNLPLVAFPERADPRDALVARRGETSLDDLRAGAWVGTDSPRRTAFVHAVRPDLHVFPLMGNVDERVARLDKGEADALILAAAALDRLGLRDRVSAYLEPELVPPAPAQGALAIQARRGDHDVLDVLRLIDNPRVRLEVLAERALLKAFGGGYTAPFGAQAETAAPDCLNVIAGAATPGGSTRHVLRALLAADDLAAGVSLIARELHHEVPIATRAVLDTRPEADPELASRLWRQGWRSVHVPTIAVVAARDGGALERARSELLSYDWVVLTSKRGVDALFDGLSGAPPTSVRWAAVGPATSRALRARGIEVEAQPAIAVGDAIPAAMALRSQLEGARVLLARADAADQSLPENLRRAGAQVDDVLAYHNLTGPNEAREPLRRALLDPELEAVIFASGSAVQGLCELAGPALALARHLKVFTIGPKTSASAARLGFEVRAEAQTTDASGLSAAAERGIEREVRDWLELQTAAFA